MIRRPNNEIKRVFHRDIQPWLRDIFGNVENDTKNIEDKITRGETQGVDQAIQTVNLKIDGIESNQNDIVAKAENSVEMLNKTEIEEELLIATGEFELSKSGLDEAKLEKSLRINESQEANIPLTESEKNRLDLLVVQKRIQMQRKNLEVLFLQSLLRKAN